MRKPLCLAVIFLTAASLAAAQPFDFPEAAVGDAAALTKAMPALAEQVIATYKEDDRGKYLDNLFRLQMVAGHYSAAADRAERPVFGAARFRRQQEGLRLQHRAL